MNGRNNARPSLCSCCNNVRYGLTTLTNKNDIVIVEAYMFSVCTPVNQRLQFLLHHMYKMSKINTNVIRSFRDFLGTIVCLTEIALHIYRVIKISNEA
jgi:hypothetical protein